MHELITEIIRRLKKWYKPQEWWKNVDYSPWEIMIAIAFSSRTSYKQVIKCMEKLRRVFRTPEDIMNMPNERLAHSIRMVGFVRRRVIMLKKLAKMIISVGGISNFLNLDTRTARKLLLSVPWIGPKTADMILVALFGEKYFIVDSNILRVLKRLKVVPQNANIYKAREIIESLIPKNERVFLHLALLHLGRTICKPKPKCEVCPLKNICKFST